ncbi:hypothetical protein [Streptomyces marianii]|nr:hypothetical protein [Streptomyces marianii]
MKIDWRAEYFCLLDGRRHGFLDPEVMRRDGFRWRLARCGTDVSAAAV